MFQNKFYFNIIKTERKRKNFLYFFFKKKKYSIKSLIKFNKIKNDNLFFKFITKKKNFKLPLLFKVIKRSTSTLPLLRLFFFESLPFLNFVKTFKNNFNVIILFLQSKNRYFKTSSLTSDVINFFFLKNNYLFYYKNFKKNLFFLKENKVLSSQHIFSNTRLMKNLKIIEKNQLKSNLLNLQTKKLNTVLNSFTESYLDFSRKKTIYNFFNFSKIFFKLMLSLRKKFTKTPMFFKISNYDTITDSFFRLTRSTKFINLYDFFLNSRKSIIFINKVSKYNCNLNSILSFNFGKDLTNNTKASIDNISTNYNFIREQGDLFFITNSNLSHSSFKNKLNFFSNFYYFWNKIDLILIFFFKPFLFKSFLNLNSFYLNCNLDSTLNSFREPFNSYSNSFFFYNNTIVKELTNLIPNQNFQYLIKKTVIKIFDFDKFSSLTTPFYYQTLVRFLEFCSGRNVCIRFNPFLNNSLTAEERMRCFLWSQRVKYFRKVLGPKLFLNESIQIMYLALRDKDPYLLSNWMVTTMYKISFWKYKTFLRYIKYVLRYFFWSVFSELGVKGIKFQLKGKISVAGNARTRTAFHYVGFTSHATFNNKILYNLSLVRSFTGVMGLKLWIVF